MPNWLWLAAVAGIFLLRRRAESTTTTTRPTEPAPLPLTQPRTASNWREIANALERNSDDADTFSRALRALGYYERTDGTFLGAFTRALRDAGIPTATAQQQSEADERLAGWLVDRLRAGPANVPAPTGSLGGRRRGTWARF